jgi:hypothetical protein
MKYIVLIIIILLICSTSAMAGEYWSNEEIALEVTYITLQFVDYKQTHAIAASENYFETNPFLGENPSKGDIDAYFAATTVAHMVIAHALPQKYRRYWQAIWINIEAGYVTHNYSIGITVKM